MATITWRRVRGAKIMTTVLVAAEINIKKREGAEGNSTGSCQQPPLRDYTFRYGVFEWLFRVQQ